MHDREGWLGVQTLMGSVAGVRHHVSKLTPCPRLRGQSRDVTGVVVVIGALSYLLVLAIGPIAELLS